MRIHGLAVVLAGVHLCCGGGGGSGGGGGGASGGPTAVEGYGSVTSGGAGGEVVAVTSLADSGPGTLRAAVLNRTLDASGQPVPRTVTFAVAGDITLLSDIRVQAAHANLTIDGATAPAPGITIRKNTIYDEFLLLGTHDVIIRHVRFRGLWTAGGLNTNNAANISLDGGNARIVLDHVTSRNATDGGPDIYNVENDVTFQWCFFFYSWHPTLIGSTSTEVKQRLSLHHNVYARNGERNPQCTGDVRDFDYVNNIVYGWGEFGGSYGMRIRGPASAVNANVVDNAFVPVPGRHEDAAIVYGSVPGADAEDAGPAGPTPPQGTVVTTSAMQQLWVSGNLLPSANRDHWSTVAGPLPTPAYAQVTAWPASELGARVLPSVGMMYRDAEEQMLLEEIAAAMGAPPPVLTFSAGRGSAAPALLLAALLVLVLRRLACSR